MDKLQKNPAKEIVTLHREIEGHVKQTFMKAVRIGELLSAQKDALPHGKFTEWVENNLPFTDRTARNYMRVYRERDRLKTETVSDLTGAYRLLTDSKKGQEIDLPMNCIPEDGHALCIKFHHEADSIHEYVFIEPSINDGYYYVTHLYSDSEDGSVQGTKKPIRDDHVRSAVQHLLDTATQSRNAEAKGF